MFLLLHKVLSYPYAFVEAILSKIIEAGQNRKLRIDVVVNVQIYGRKV